MLASVRKRIGHVMLVCLFASMFAASASADELPPDLNAVPRNATCFMHFRAAEIWNHEALVDLRYIVKAAGADTLKTFQEMFAPNPKNIDRFTLVMPTYKDFDDLFPYSINPDMRGPLVIIRTKKAFDHLRLLEQIAFRDKFYRRNHYYFNEDGWRALVVIDSRTFLVGPEASVLEYFNQLAEEPAAANRGPLQAALKRATGKHLFTVGMTPRNLTKGPGFEFMPAPVRAMFEAQSWVGTASIIKNTVDLDVQLDFADAKTAKSGEQSVQAVLKISRQGLKSVIEQGLKELVKDKEKASIKNIPEKFSYVVGLGFLRELDRVLKTLPIAQKGNQVRVSLKYDKLKSSQTTLVAGLGAISLIGIRSYGRFATAASVGSDGKKDPRKTHLKNIYDALQKYHKDKGTYPPAAIYDKYGRPILSWRVALLPYMGDAEKQLYRQFRLNEPWDGPNNKQLLQRMPQSFRTPNQYVRYQGKTTTVSFSGRGTIFEGPKGIRTKDIPPKTLLMVLSSENETYWTKPGDIRVEPGEPLPKLFPQYRNQVFAILADGTFKELNRNIAKEKLRAMIYRTSKPIAAANKAKFPQVAWDDFIQIDDIGAKRALKTVKKLVAEPKVAVPFLKSKLKAVPKLDEKAVAKLIDELGSENFRTRAKANKALLKTGILAVPLLQKKLKDNLPLEVSARIRKLVARFTNAPNTPDDLRAVRSVLVLQEIGNADAKTFLARLAKGADGAILTIHAKKALERLKDR